MEYTYDAVGTCAYRISFNLDNGVVRNIKFFGGCDGNLKAIQKILDGVAAEDIIEKCGGIRCEQNQTSCADQLSIAVREALTQMSRDA